MKKNYLMIAAAALVMASCSQNEVRFQDFQEAAIGFTSAGIEKNTRAELDLGWFLASGNAFGVYGNKNGEEIFGNATENTAEVVTRENGDWTNPTVRFWDKASKEYNFYAYAPASVTEEFADGKFTFDNLSIIKNIASADADIAIAEPLNGIGYYNCETTGNGHGKGHVEFIFNHILSKLSFKINESGKFAAASADVTVKNIDINFPTGTAKWEQTANTGVAGSITYTGYASADAIASGEASMASGDADKYSIAVSSTDQTLTTTASAIGETFIVTPLESGQTKHEFAIRVKYQVEYSDGTNVTDYAYGVVKNYSPTQNSSYVITVTLDPETIQFCVDNVVDWVPASGDATVE